MEINKIKYFISVYELGSMRKAAEFIKMSSGSLSKSIKSLEDELGVKLFVPDGRNIRPTEEATTVYRNSRDLIEKYNHFFDSLKERKVAEKVIRIASWEVFSTYLISRFCQDEINHSNLSLEVLERPPESLEEAILNNEVDIGITYAPIAHPNLEYLKITKFNFNIFGNNKYNKIDSISWPFAVPILKIKNSLLDVKALDHWPEEINRSIKYKFEMLETALETSRLGLSVIHCPDFIIKLQNQMLKKEYQIEKLEIKKYQKHQSLDVIIVIRKGFPENKIVKKLAKALRTALLGS